MKGKMYVLFNKTQLSSTLLIYCLGMYNGVLCSDTCARKSPIHPTFTKWYIWMYDSVDRDITGSHSNLMPVQRQTVTYIHSHLDSLTPKLAPFMRFHIRHFHRDIANTKLLHVSCTIPFHHCIMILSRHVQFRYISIFPLNLIYIPIKLDLLSFSGPFY